MTETIGTSKAYPDQSFEFGSPPQPQEFVGPGEPAASHSCVMPVTGFERACTVHLIPEEDGGYSAIAADLPGVASQGETEQEALDNIREAYASAIRCYKQHGKTVPWLNTPEPSEPGSVTRSVVIHGGDAPSS